MPQQHDDNQQLSIMNFVYDAVIADADTVLAV